jgi:hypothetical protein
VRIRRSCFDLSSLSSNARRPIQKSADVQTKVSSTLQMPLAQSSDLAMKPRITEIGIDTGAEYFDWHDKLLGRRIRRPVSAGARDGKQERD